jgi:multidrug resistance protein MdtO
MATHSASLPSVAPERTSNQAATWFWGFLKNEMAPYPGRAWVVARMTIAATIVMTLVMTFQLPNGFIGALYTIVLSRESPAATLRSAIRIAISSALSVTYTILSISMLAGDPLTHFLWVMATLFMSFFAMRAIADYGAALAFSLPSVISITIWDANTTNVNTRIENTLWLGFLLVIGSAATVAVEYVLRQMHPTTILNEQIESRLKAVQGILENVGAGQPISAQSSKAISQYAGLGTSSLRRQLQRSGHGGHFIARMNAAVALVGRLVDLAASMRNIRVNSAVTADEEDRARCLALADHIATLRRNLLEHQPLLQIDVSNHNHPTKLVFLAAMERTLALIPHAFLGSNSTSDFLMHAPIDEHLDRRIFVPDAFSNSAHLKFALRGSLAALVCYVTYNALIWPGLKSSMVTCLLTAATTIGSSRQRQVLRLGGFVLGGIVLGIGAQAFLLPHLDSIVGFGLLFAVVAAISSWIATATPRISFLGLQLALAFNLVHLLDFTIQTSLAVARDRLVGVLLGLISMWLIFDHLWVKDAMSEMQSAFAHNLQLFAELTRQLHRPDHDGAIERIRLLREQIGSGLAAVLAQSDAILFEFGPDRERKLEIRAHMRRWDPSLRTLLQVQLTFFHYQLQRSLENLPAISEAEIAFNADVGRTIQLMADEVCGKPAGPAPDVNASASQLEEQIRKHYADVGLPIDPQVADVLSLIQNLRQVLVPLYQDIQISFADMRQGTTISPPLAPLLHR